MFGAALAWITVVPNATPVTGTVAVVAPWANTAVAGTVAVAGVTELKFTVMPPAGAAAESVSVRFCVPKPEIVRLAV